MRPVRVALAVTADIEVLRSAVHCATSTWGGLYHLLLTPEDTEAALDLARAGSADVVHALADDPGCRNLAEAPGFQWRGKDRWGPFGPPTEYMSSRLLGPELCLGQAADPTMLLHWDADDPLADLYSVWFGEYGGSEYELNLAVQFAAAGTQVSLDRSQPLAIPADAITPIGLTALDIQYTGAHRPFGFALVDPSEPADLINFWNIRACGGRVWPWPIGHGERVRNAADAWLNGALQSGAVPRIQSGTGRDLGAYIAVWKQSELPIPSELDRLLNGHAGIYRVPVTEPWRGPLGWRGYHPLQTSYTRQFTLSVTDGNQNLSVPLPALPVKPPPRTRVADRIVAAQIDIYRESGFSPELTVTIPNDRRLASLLHGYGNIPETFHRPTADGRAIGISYNTEYVNIGAVPLLGAFEALLEGAEWTCRQSDSGRFAARLIERLSSTQTSVGNQPAVRWVLSDAARAPHGKPIAQLIQTAKNNQGNWPAIRHADRVRDYPKRMVYFLLDRKILLPLLQVRCPACASIAYLSPEAITTDVRCEMCLKESPLGLILGATGASPTWHYRTASSLTADRLAEAMPIMACLSALSAALDPGHLRTAPHILGLSLKGGKTWSCEIDLAMVTNKIGAPIVIVGEIKSYRDSITATDLANLAKVQDYLRSVGIECLVMAATLREKLEAEEHQVLRQYCEHSPAEPVLGHNFRPVLPIIFTGTDLSVPEHAAGHPTGWAPGMYDLLDLAEQSCRRNLGLAAVNYSGGDTTTRWALTWTDVPVPSPPNPS